MRGSLCSPKSATMRSLPIQIVASAAKSQDPVLLAMPELVEQAHSSSGKTPQIIAIFDTRTDSNSRMVLWGERPFRFRSCSPPSTAQRNGEGYAPPDVTYLSESAEVVGELDLIIRRPVECWQLD
jgi:hypothetical protein